MFDGAGALPVEARLGALTVQATLPAQDAAVTTTRAGGALTPLAGLLGLGLAGLLGLLSWRKP